MKLEPIDLILLASAIMLIPIITITIHELLFRRRDRRLAIKQKSASKKKRKSRRSFRIIFPKKNHQRHHARLYMTKFNAAHTYTTLSKET